jgi:DNA segregation ATPase FtsK/SpoIIIE-like protein
MKKDKKDLLIAISLFVTALLLLAAMISYTPYDISFETSTPNIHIRSYIGITGAYTAWAIFKMIGYAGFFMPLLLSIWAIGILAEKLSQKFWIRFLGMVVLFLSSATFFSLTEMGNSELMVDRGGLLGFLLGNVAFDYFGIIGGYIITVALSILALLVATEFLIVPIISLLLFRVLNLINKISRRNKPVNGQASKKTDVREDSRPKLKSQNLNCQYQKKNQRL